MGGRQQAVLRDCLTEAGWAQTKGERAQFPQERVGEVKVWWHPANPPTSPSKCAGEDRAVGAYLWPLREDCQGQKPVSSPRRVSSCLEHSKGPGAGQGQWSVPRLRAGGGLQTGQAGGHHVQRPSRAGDNMVRLWYYVRKDSV